MTFYEAALQILQREGKPLHAREITELAIKESLLSHVGMQPEITMASRLAAMARRSEDRRLVAVEPDTFGLTDWTVEITPDALEQSGVTAVHDESEPPLRGKERHPRIDKENVRVAGRGDRRRKYEELERKKKKKKKRLAPLADLVFDVLDRAGRALPLFELAAAIREHDLLGEDIGREALANQLRAENERREGEGRSPVFAFTDDGRVGIENRTEPEEEADLAALVAQVVAKLAEERKPAPEAAAPAAAAPAGGLDALVAAERSRAVSTLRQRLSELDAGGLEAVTQGMLDTLGYRDVRVAKRHKEGALFTARRRMGLTEVRFAIRVVRAGRDVRREDVVELRKDMQSHSAQMGVLVSPADPTREARGEAANAGAALVTLLCADALAEQLAERGMGVRQRVVTLTEFDDRAFRRLASQRGEGAATAPAAEGRESAQDRRERREKERREWREKRAREREERRRARLEAEAARAKEEAKEGEAHGAIAATALFREPAPGAEEPMEREAGEAAAAAPPAAVEPAPAAVEPEPAEAAPPAAASAWAGAERPAVEPEPEPEPEPGVAPAAETVPAEAAGPAAEPEAAPKAPTAIAEEPAPTPPAAKETVEPAAVAKEPLAALPAARAAGAAAAPAGVAPEVAAEAAPAEEAPAEAAPAEEEPERPRRRRRRPRAAAADESTEPTEPEAEPAPERAEDETEG